MSKPDLDDSKPNFLILGAQKCGTSWLHTHLSAHPDVFLPAIKELEFFSYERHLSRSGFADYLKNFAGQERVLARGEASASYFWTSTSADWDSRPEGYQRNIPRVVKQYLGADLRFVVVIRNPVQRALSAYAHYVAHEEIPPNQRFREARRYGGIIDMGFYARHLQNWFEYFPSSRFLVISLEMDIVPDPARTLLEVQGFLGVPPMTASLSAANRPVFPGTSRKVLNDGSVEFVAPPHHKDQLVPEWPVSAGEIEELMRIFDKDAEELGKITGRDYIRAWGF